jgi:cytoskeletal protein RodZ
MESFGAYLKGLRDERGKTLEQISANTKIAFANLEFLEKDRYELLPPRVFVKGFIRSYAQELEVNPDEVLRRFEEFISEGEMPDYTGEEHPVFSEKQSISVLPSSPWFTVGLTAAGIVSLAILILTGVTRLLIDDKGPRATQPTVTTAGPGGPDSAGTSHSAGLTRKGTGQRKLEIKAFSNTWIRVEPDGGTAEELVMAPGDVRVFTAKEAFRLQTGNAGGIRVWFDGRELQVLGKTNQSLALTLP